MTVKELHDDIISAINDGIINWDSAIEFTISESLTGLYCVGINSFYININQSELQN